MSHKMFLAVSRFSKFKFYIYFSPGTTVKKLQFKFKNMKPFESIIL